MPFFLKTVRDPLTNEDYSSMTSENLDFFKISATSLNFAEVRENNFWQTFRNFGCHLENGVYLENHVSPAFPVDASLIYYLKIFSTA